MKVSHKNKRNQSHAFEAGGTSVQTSLSIALIKGPRGEKVFSAPVSLCEERIFTAVSRSGLQVGIRVLDRRRFKRPERALTFPLGILQADREFLS